MWFRNYVAVSFSVVVLASTSAQADHGGLGVGIGIASPIITDSAITLPVGMTVIGLRTQYIGFDTFSDKELLGIKNAYGDSPRSDVHSLTGLLNPALFAAYGLTDTLSLGVRIPANFRFSVRQPNEERTEVDHLGDANGFGDIIAFGQWRFWHTQNNATHAALIAGLKFPTGMDHVKTKQGEDFEAHFQPGSGSWDPILGGAFTHGFGQWSIDTSVLYTFAGRGVQATDLGDSFTYNAAVSYALGGTAPNALYAETNAANWVLVGEVNGEWHAKQNTRGEPDPNTGGNLLYLSPGVRYSPGANWNISLSFGVPIVRNVYGFQDKPDYRIVNRVSIIF